MNRTEERSKTKMNGNFVKSNENVSKEQQKKYCEELKMRIKTRKE